ncbi:hypothetical protein D3C71_1466360 [compost metagenome]
MPIVDRSACKACKAKQDQRPEHDVLAAVTITDRSGNQRANQKADIGTACQIAHLKAGQLPLRTQGRKQEGNNARVPGFKHVAQTAHHQ